MDEVQEKPRYFTAQTAGWYHYGRTPEPHLLDECTEACRSFGGPYVAEPGEIRTVELAFMPADARLGLVQGQLVASMNSGSGLPEVEPALELPWQNG